MRQRAGSNFGEKRVKEIGNDFNFTIVRQERFGISMFGIQIQWQKGLFSKIKEYQPERVIFMFNAGIVNYSLLMIYLNCKKTPYFIWGSGHKRVGLSVFKHKIKDFFKAFFVSKSAGYISYSNYFAEQLKNQGYDQKRIYCAQNTMNIEKIIEGKNRDKFSREYDNIRFLFVGTLIPQKNLEKAIKVCKLLKDENYQFRFDIVGDGPIQDELEHNIESFNLKDTVFFHGAKYGEDVAGFFGSSNIFLLPGTGGLAINEAMAYGLPIISTPGDGTAYDLVINGENGFLLDYDYNIDELFCKMEFFLNCGKSKIENMVKRSLNIVNEKATLNNMVESFSKALLN